MSKLSKRRSFFINGTSKIQIINPKAGDKLNLADGEFAVTIHATNSSGSLKKVTLDVWDSDAISIGFTMMKPPTAALRWFDGEYSREFESGKPLKFSELILLASADHRDVGHNANISKLEIFANGFRVCIDDSPVLGYGGECIWKPSPGKYRLQTAATDEDGAVGKSDEIEIVIERP